MLEYVRYNSEPELREYYPLKRKESTYNLSSHYFDGINTEMYHLVYEIFQDNER